MRNRRINSDKLKMMRCYLPQGSNKIIASKTGLTPIYVSKVLHGVHSNMTVIEEALKIAVEEKTKSEALNTVLDSTFKQ
jgi:hypothetical protein